MTDDHQTFLQFPALPLEIRQIIWSLAHREPLVHCIDIEWKYKSNDVAFLHSQIFYSHHRNLNLSCRESWWVGQWFRTSSDPINSELDYIYVRLPYAYTEKRRSDILQS